VFGVQENGERSLIATEHDGLYVVDNEYFGLSEVGATAHKQSFQTGVAHTGPKAANVVSQMNSFVSNGLGLIVQTLRALGAVAGPSMNSVQLIHYRFMGASESTVKSMARRGIATPFPTMKEICAYPWCPHCIAAKLTKLPFPKASDYRASELGELVHFDVFGPLKPTAIGGYRYVLALVDDFCRGGWVVLLKFKSELQRKLEIWQEKFETRWSKLLKRTVKVKAFRCDNAGENTSNQMNDYLFSHRISMENSIPRCSAQNGIAEQFIWRLTLMVRHNFYAYRCPWKLWGLAFQNAAQTKWSMEQRANPNKMSPWQRVTGMPICVKFAAAIP